jgi:hypothetical protein
MIVRSELDGSYAGIKCDTCGIPAPSTDEIMKGHGLSRMGWYCSGGVHICPIHAHPKPAPRTPPKPLARTRATT